MSTNQNEIEIAKQLLKLNVKKQTHVSTCPYIKRKHNVFYVVNKKKRKRTQNGQTIGVYSAEERKLAIQRYSPEERKLAIQRYMEKRKRRVWTKRCPYIKRKHNVFYVVNKKNKKRNNRSSIRQLQELNMKRRRTIAELKHQLAHLRSGKKLKSCLKCKKAGGICTSRGKKGHLPLISVSEEDMAVIDQKKRRHHATQNGKTHVSTCPYMKRKQHDFYVVETQNGQTIGTERKSAFQPFKRRARVKVLKTRFI